MVSSYLRKLNYKGSITIISEENFLPYQRPPLSKAFINDELEQEKLLLKSEAYYKKNEIELLINKRVTNISRKEKFIEISNLKYKYEYLVIATGSKPRNFQFTCDENNIHYLRTLNDACQIRSTLKKVKTIVIIGAGYIGLEVASIAIKKNLKVIVIEAGERVMNRVVCKTTSDFFQKKHETQGVEFIFNSMVQDIQDGENKQKRIICNNGLIITADAVIVGAGIKPNTSLAKDGNIECNNGIIVNELGQTNDKNIYATGDCTNHPNEIYETRLRLESVHNAVEQSKTVASSITGEINPYCEVPWFWSDQYDLKLQLAGISNNFDDFVIRGQTKNEIFSVIYLRNKKVIAIDSINDRKTFMTGKKIIHSKIIIKKSDLKDEKINLKHFLKVN